MTKQSNSAQYQKISSLATGYYHQLPGSKMAEKHPAPASQSVLSQVPFMTGVELASAIREGRVSSVEALKVLLDRIRSFDAPDLNVVIELHEERALQRALLADQALKNGIIWGPYHGVPMTVKESVEVSGMKCTLGDPAMKDYISPGNEHVVRMMEQAGAVIFGKTNVPLHVNDFQTFNQIYGSTSNPWDTKRTPGGSSGGSAAALACCFTPIEIGSDVGGSVRIPAAFCGVFGHKASYGIIPGDGSRRSKYPLEISTRGPMARCPEDLALMMRLFATGPRRDIGEAWTLKLPEPRKSRLQDFKVAMWLDDENSPVCDELRNAGKKLGEQLQNIGVHVDFAARPSFEPYGNMRTYYHLTAANRAISYGEDSSRVTLLKYRLAQEQRETIREAWSEFFSRFDILIVPSHSSMAFLKDERAEDTERKMEYNYNGELYKAKYYRGLFWSFLTNVGYLPSTTFPCGIDPESGLPLGLNAVGKEFDDLITIDFVRLLCEEFGIGFVIPPNFKPQPSASL